MEWRKEESGYWLTEEMSPEPSFSQAEEEPFSPGCREGGEKTLNRKEETEVAEKKELT